MKTALDLPDALFKQIKLEAVQQGRKLKDLVAELLLRGLEASRTTEPVGKAKIGRDPVSGLPVVRCKCPAPGSAGLTPERMADILLDQEVTWAN